MIILVIINFFWLEWDYHTNGGFTEDYVKVNASEKENKYYEELHQYLDGKLNAEKVSYVSEEYQRYHNLVSGDYSTEYDSSMHTGYAFGDYSLLTVHFYNPIKYLITYKELNDGLLEKAEENIRFFQIKIINTKLKKIHSFWNIIKIEIHYIFMRQEDGNIYYLMTNPICLSWCC